MKKGAKSEKALNKNALSEALISIDKVRVCFHAQLWLAMLDKWPLSLWNFNFRVITIVEVLELRIE